MKRIGLKEVLRCLRNLMTEVFTQYFQYYRAAVTANSNIVAITADSQQLEVRAYDIQIVA